ncbi:response regulator transcription factor [Vibrio spartinae]|uniref:Transcriptional activator protein CzcR n=1 Tax=Vibrio spartinae TaxID=1918945 RepID=A0A1N6LZR0_9VIBR|nr:response regulator transcription factor [Vibrio spartinae]SIO92669.1 Transcriptional activator protein CzcR [Vibrio spartinae]
MRETQTEVLLIEDDKDLAHSIADYLRLDKIICDHAYNGHTGLNLAMSNHYDAILLDLMLPRIDGFSLCEILRSRGNDTPILMLTAKDTLEDKVAGFQVGTDDYLVKPFAMQELALRTKALSRRKSGQVHKLLIADLEYDLLAKRVIRAGQEIRLTPLNMILLEVLMRKSPATVNRRELENILWPNDIPDSNNLRVQIYQLRQQLDKPFARPLIHTVQGHGFRLGENLS